MYHVIELTNRLEELQEHLDTAETSEREMQEKLRDEQTKREDLEFKLEEQNIESENNRPTSKAQTDDLDDLEDFGDHDEVDKNYFMGEIEDLKQQLLDMQEEKTFAEDELKETLSAEKEKNILLTEQVQTLKVAKEQQKINSTNTVWLIFCQFFLPKIFVEFFCLKI